MAAASSSPSMHQRLWQHNKGPHNRTDGGRLLGTHSSSNCDVFPRAIDRSIDRRGPHRSKIWHEIDRASYGPSEWPTAHECRQ